MLIVGAGAALTAIAAFYLWLFVNRLRASWRERKAKERFARRRVLDEQQMPKERTAGNGALREKEHEHAQHFH
jgi:hypothetical protein